MGQNSHTISALLLAPLAVPITLLPFLIYGNMVPFWILISLILSALVSYAGTLLLGLPVLLILWGRGYTACWISIVVGLIVGPIMMMLFTILLVSSLGQGKQGIRLAISDPHTLIGYLWFGGILGVIVSALFWLIAKPEN